MTFAKACKEFDGTEVGESTDLAQDRVVGQMKWLAHVAEGEFTLEDRKKLVSACRTFYGQIRPLVVKYVDGE